MTMALWGWNAWFKLFNNMGYFVAVAAYISTYVDLWTGLAVGVFVLCSVARTFSYGFYIYRLHVMEV